VRDPSVHIKESTLREIMPKILACDNVEDAVNKLFKLSKGKIPVNRVNIKTTTKTRKKVKKVAALLEEDLGVELFQRLLIEYRTITNHRGIRAIKKGDVNYTNLVEVTKLATSFIEDFKLPKETGYIEFIKRGIALMGRKYGINRFKYHYEKICMQYENTLLLKQDDNPKGTKEVYNIWKVLMLEYAGGEYLLSSDDELVNMVLARQEADELGADYKDWMTAQFEGLAWLKTVPELVGFFGINAKSRYRKYSTNFVDKEAEVVVVNKNMSEAQLRYQKLRNKRANG